MDRLRNSCASTSIVVLIAFASAMPLTGCMYVVPGKGYDGPRVPLSATQTALHDELEKDVRELSTTVGPRNAAQSVKAVHAAQKWIESRLSQAGVSYRMDSFDINGPSVANVEASIAGTKHPNEIVLLGAHYDTVFHSPGANDNGSGVAALLAVARRIQESPLERTVRIVFFVNEESPFSFGHQMGSRVYAKRCKERGDRIIAMICIDSLGCFSDAPSSQRYPRFIAWRFSSVANFVGFCSNASNRELLDRIVNAFRAKAKVNSIGVALDSKDANRSDHAAFVEQGYPAVLMSDTSEFRDVNYHKRTDTPEKLDYDRLTLACDGLLAITKELGKSDESTN